MRRRLPPLEQIEAFIEAAQAPSFRVAAERCALSPAAFSRRIQSFSSYVGLRLFERRPGGLRLTPAGERCLAELKPALLELRRAAASVARRNDEALSVTLSLSHSLAVGWLIPRMDAFRAAHPEIELSLKTQRGASDLRCGEADLGVCFSDIDLTGLVSRPLLSVTVAPVASPEVARSFKARGGRLERHRLLSVSQPPDMWPWWARETGLAAELPSASTCDLLHAMYEMASEGFGVALAAAPTVWPHLENGRLVRLDLPHAAFPGGYHLVAPADRRDRAPVEKVWRWLEFEAERTPDISRARIAA
ncbi:LysR substrate-binding domain-containing protein [Phenylobacterium sp.]|uniref:LysR family transcriptional regulator n=1 Tax=Phenylobacterium sp. TaxID=1871053 RepID=UPI00286BC177|nr:LysR substrate-binding domain-containing protein [Phenylobacterium sp.]